MRIIIITITRTKAEGNLFCMMKYQCTETPESENSDFVCFSHQLKDQRSRQSQSVYGMSEG
jgi:hypothetical protein